MSVKILKRSFFQRLFGIPATAKPGVDDCWHYEDGKLTVDLAKTRELKSPGGAIRLEGKNLPRRVLVVHGEDGEFRAYHNRCSHLGHRRMDPVPGTDTVQCCSVNKSTYDSQGNKIFGPAPHPITRYTAEKDGERLIVTLPR